MSWIDGGWVPVPVSLQRTKFYREDKYLAFFLRLLLKKGYQTEFVFWEGRDRAVLPNSLRTSVRELAKEFGLPRTTLWERLNYFAKNGFIEVIRSKQSGLIIRVLESEAFRTLSGQQSGQLSGTASGRNNKGTADTGLNGRTLPGHHAGHESGHVKSDPKSRNQKGSATIVNLYPDTNPDTNPDTISLIYRYLINPSAKLRFLTGPERLIRNRVLTRSVKTLNSVSNNADISGQEYLAHYLLGFIREHGESCARVEQGALSELKKTYSIGEIERALRAILKDGKATYPLKYLVKAMPDVLERMEGEEQKERAQAREADRIARKAREDAARDIEREWEIEVVAAFKKRHQGPKAEKEALRAFYEEFRKNVGTSWCTLDNSMHRRMLIIELAKQSRSGNQPSGGEGSQDCPESVEKRQG